MGKPSVGFVGDSHITYGTRAILTVDLFWTWPPRAKEEPHVIHMQWDYLQCIYNVYVYIYICTPLSLDLQVTKNNCLCSKKWGFKAILLATLEVQV